LTDFGSSDAYVGCVKGVLLSINPKLNIVDISNEVPKFDVKRAGLILAQTARYFPKGTVHMSIVDPEVGTRRKLLLIETRRFFFVGPDNGILSVAAMRDGVLHAFQIDEVSCALPERSATFAARDIFAPVAARLTLGVRPCRLGDEIAEFKRLQIGEAVPSEKGIVGEVLMIDCFGNLVTNVGGESLGNIKPGQRILIRIGDKALRVPFLRAYGEARKGEPLALIGSAGFLEIGLNQGNASRILPRARSGSKVTVKQ
jgi:hypothetical protein